MKSNKKYISNFFYQFHSCKKCVFLFENVVFRKKSIAKLSQIEFSEPHLWLMHYMWFFTKILQWLFSATLFCNKELCKFFCSTCNLSMVVNLVCDHYIYFLVNKQLEISTKHRNVWIKRSKNLYIQGVSVRLSGLVFSLFSYVKWI